MHFYSRSEASPPALTIKGANTGVVSGHDTVINNNNLGAAAAPTPDPKAVEAYPKTLEEGWKATTDKLDEVNQLIGGASIPAPAAAPTPGGSPH